MKLGVTLKAVLLSFSAFIFSSCAYRTGNPSQLAMNGENFIALNKTAVKNRTDWGKKILCYGFSENQKDHLKNTIYKKSGASITVTVEFDTKSKNKMETCPFSFGFVYDEDRELCQKSDEKIKDRPSITGDYLECRSGRIKMAYSVSSFQDLPDGFFVYSTRPLTVIEASIEEAKIGWINRRGCPEFDFGPNGGKISWDFSSVDLRDFPSLFPDKNTVKKIMPKIELGLVPIEDVGTWKNQLSVGFECGPEKIRMRLQKNQGSAVIQLSSLKKPDSTIIFTDHKELVASAVLKANSPNLAMNKFDRVLYPLKTDLGLIIDWPVENWRKREYELFEWNLFPGVLFFDFANYKIQNKFFTRLAYYVEKAGYKGTLVGDDFVEKKRGYNAHDYRAEDLASFFSLADAQEFSLNEMENLLREILEANGIIVKNKDGFYDAGKGAVVSFSRESPGYLRRTFLAHESWHGIYFTDEEFRNMVSVLYSMFDPESMEFLKTFWETQPGLGYDISDEYLMQNEFMAYIMQQTLPNVMPYFIQIAGRGSVNRIQKEGANYIRETKAQAFGESGEILNDYAFDRWGLACGRVHLMQRN